MVKRRNFLKTSLAALPALIIPVPALLKNKKLPKILILGDSISIGYTPFVKQILRAWADVYRPMQANGKPENCQGTTNGIQNIKRWLGDTKWDIIHFNFGLHDIKHVHPETGKNSTNPDHPLQANLKQYKKNLNAIVEILKETGAELIFATTTPYPSKVSGPLRSPEMPGKYNRVAVNIMNKNGIRINNLHAFVLPRMTEIQKPQNVHFTKAGSQALAKQVANHIQEILDE